MSQDQENHTVVKRFIAGAVCPKCQAMDKLRTYTLEGKQFRDCVSCGFEEEMSFPESPQQGSGFITSDKP